MYKAIISFVATVMFLTVAFLPTTTYAADTSRGAEISSYMGTVEVKKAGGKKSIIAFKNMKLNQGDEIITGADSSAILQFSNNGESDDQLILEANSTIVLSKVSNKESTVTKVKLKRGKAWVDVSSINNNEDVFQLETPEGILNVRGTNFFVGVDSNTGQSVLGMFSGIVNYNATVDRSQGTNYIYPAQIAFLDSQNEENVGNMSNQTLEEMLKDLSSEVAQAIVANLIKINEENEMLIDKMNEQPVAGLSPDALTNINRIAYALLNELYKTGKISEDAYKLKSEELSNSGPTVGDIPSSVLQSSDADKILELNRKKREERLNESNNQLSKLEELKRQQEELKKKNEELKKEREAEALQKYKENLSKEEQEKLLKRQADLEAARKTPTPTPDSGSSPTPPPSPTPDPEPTPNPAPTPDPEPTPNPAPDPAPTPNPDPTPDPEPSPGPDPTPDPNEWFYNIENPLYFRVTVDSEEFLYEGDVISQGKDNKLLFETTEVIKFGNGDRVTFFISTTNSDSLEIRGVILESHYPFEAGEPDYTIPIETVDSDNLTFKITIDEKDGSGRTVEVTFKILAELREYQSPENIINYFKESK
ncbi:MULTISPECIES: FecR family protein [Solibacillus]|uniref:FecR domain-containing protein n=1 Tax=Solibacillus merdavium TaxID=2762218 RepID=A0ABR8XQT0_9BACL|nr:FecR family protein [Solibacillus merdavium]MBD8034282.1 FecR domain-containing protein [Solibacillus merdavium]